MKDAVQSLARRIVTMAVPRDDREALLGDLAEELERRGPRSWRAVGAYVAAAIAASGYAVLDRLRSPKPKIFGGAGFEFRQAWRGLRRTPAVSIIAAVTLAIGIGASVAIFSAVNPILFEPLPYPHANRVLSIADYNALGTPMDVTYGTFRELADRSHSFDSLAVADAWRPALTQGDEPERLSGQSVSAAYLTTIGIPPVIGRDFNDADYDPNGPRPVIVSAALLQRRLGGDTSIVGRTIDLNGVPYLVVGIMPRSFENVLAPAADVWTPLRYRSTAPFQSAEWGHHLKMIARVRADVPLDQVRRDLAAIAEAPIAQYPRAPWANMSNGLIVSALKDEVSRGVRSTLLAVLGAVALVLLIACVNVTNLLLARSASRVGEFAVRAALGAGRSRLVRQLLVESLLLACVGGALGLALAQVGVRALVALSPPGLPRVEHIQVDATAFAFALLLTTIVGLAVGLAPAIGASDARIADRLHQHSGRSTGNRLALRRSLVVAEVALALVLLVGAGLLWRSLTRLFAVAPGLEPSHVLTLQVQAAGARYIRDDARLQFFEQALDAVRALPGVTSAAFTSQLPLSGDAESFGVAFDRGMKSRAEDNSSAYRYVVTPDYFKTLQIPLVKGRLLDAGDRPGGPEAVLLSESYARSQFPNGDAIGTRLRIGPEIASDRPWDTVVGIVGDVKQESLTLDQPAAFYVANGQWSWVDATQSLVVKTDLDPAPLTLSVKRAIWSVDPHLPIVRVLTMRGLVDRSEAERHFALTIFQVFALVALTLAAIGLYSVLAAHVTERWREIGVRSALGASREHILGMVLRQGLRLTALGVVFGLVGAVLGSRAIEALLFGTSKLDPLTYATVIATMTAVSVVACWVPAWRAARVDPLIALRAE